MTSEVIAYFREALEGKRVILREYRSRVNELQETLFQLCWLLAYGETHKAQELALEILKKEAGHDFKSV